VTHTEPDVLALLALGEHAGTAAEREHVAACAECARRLEEFASVAEAGRAGDPADGLLRPSDRVWEGIAGALGVAPGIAPGALPDTTPGAAPGGSPDAERTAPDRMPSGAHHVRGAASPGPGARPSAPVAPLPRGRSSRGRRRTWLAVAAALVLVGGIGTAVVVGALGARQGAVLAEATLDALPDWPDAGGSAVVREADGERTLDVRVSRDTEPGSVREVWLISGDLTKLVSVGLLATDEGTFALPPDIDLDEYRVVDVSAEPLDGDPGHSADSIVRGTLRSA
jgi:hypothetical protein